MAKATRKRETQPPAEDQALTAAIDRVYEKYGTNLSAFIRDVRNELELKREELPRQNRIR